MLKANAIGKLAEPAGRGLCGACWDLCHASRIPRGISDAVIGPVMWFATRIWSRDRVMKWFFIWLLDYARRNDL